MNADPTNYLQLADRYGLPLVFLAFATMLLVWGVRAVWGFSKPLASRTADSLMNLIQKQSDFIDTVSTHQQELKTLVETGHNGHAKTHEALQNLSQQVGELSRGHK